jgi:hypothetical protein
MQKFTKESFKIIQVTEIPKECLLPGVIKLLSGRALMVDTDDEFQDEIYSGDIFEQIGGEIAERYFSLPHKDVIEQIDNLAEVIETELIRLNGPWLPPEK